MTVLPDAVHACMIDLWNESRNQGCERTWSSRDVCSARHSIFFTCVWAYERHGTSISRYTSGHTRTCTWFNIPFPSRWDRRHIFTRLHPPGSRIGGRVWVRLSACVFKAAPHLQALTWPASARMLFANHPKFTRKDWYWWCCACAVRFFFFRCRFTAAGRMICKYHNCLIIDNAGALYGSHSVHRLNFVRLISFCDCPTESKNGRQRQRQRRRMGHSGGVFALAIQLGMPLDVLMYLGRCIGTIIKTFLSLDVAFLEMNTGWSEVVFAHMFHQLVNWFCTHLVARLVCLVCLS